MKNRPLCAVLVLALAGIASAEFLTPSLDLGRSVLDGARFSLFTDFGAFTAVTRALVVLSRGEDGPATLLNEVRTASRVVRILQPHAGAHSDLLAPFVDAESLYRDRLLDVRGDLPDVAAAAGLPRNIARMLHRRVTGADRAALRIAATEFRSARERYAALVALASRTNGIAGLRGGPANWVIQNVSLPVTAALSDAMALDLDGDLEHLAENRLGSVIATLSEAGHDLQGVVDDRLDATSAYTVLHLWRVALPNAVPSLVAGVSSAIDLDGDPLDNFGGDELFELAAHPLLALSPDDSSVDHLVRIAAHDVEFAGIRFLDSYPIVVDAAPSSDGTQLLGRVGGAVSSQTLFDILDEGGIVPDIDPVTLASLLEPDVDVDGDGVRDAISCCFAFTAAPAHLAFPQ